MFFLKEQTQHFEHYA